MTTAALTAAAIHRCKGGASFQVADNRGNRIGRVCRNRFGLWECFYGVAHVAGSHLTAADAVRAIQDHHRSCLGR